MTKETFDWIVSVTGLAGFVVTVVGFVYTIYQVKNANTAAQAAKKASEDVRRDMIRFSTISDCSQALSIMDELRKLHRFDTGIQHLPERYSTLKRLLVSIRESGTLSDGQKDAVQGAIQHFSGMENAAERALALKEKLVDIPKKNKIVSAQIDRVHEILVAITSEASKRNG